MPQDELWATSARLTGYQVTHMFDPLFDGKDQLIIRPTWSKRPSGARDGYLCNSMSAAMRWHAPEVIRTGVFELLGGQAKNMPVVVRHELRRIAEGFEEGSLH